MANKIRGDVDFKAGDEIYTLCYNHNALIELEELLGIGIVAIVSEMEKWGPDPERIRLKWVRAMLCAGLKKHHPKLTLDNVSEIMDNAGRGMSLMGPIGEAISASFASDLETSEVRPTVNGTGPVSSPSTFPMVTT